MIQIDLITGFLGSGKTTFLLGYAKYLMRQGMKIGILEYDHGSVNVDMLLLQELRGPQCELEMLSAACDADCHKRRLKTKLIAMAMTGYDRVLVEPSGVFDADEFFDNLRESPLDRWYEIGSVITVVNARLEPDLSPEADFMLASQCANAGCVLLSRVQQAEKEQIEETCKHLHRALKQIQCSKNIDRILFAKDWSTFDDEDYRHLMNCSYSLYDYVKLTAGSETEFESVSLLDHTLSVEEMRDKIEAFFHDQCYGSILRVKGFAQEGTQWYEVNATEYETTMKPVVIGKPVMIVIGNGLNEPLIRDFCGVRQIVPPVIGIQ